jgi:hypothetical protein
MGMKSPFDGKELITGYLLMSYAIVVFTIFILEPFSMEGMENFAIIALLIALIFTLYFTIKALQLYGRKSNEGKFWYKIIWMMIFFAVGISLEGTAASEYHVFSIFAFLAFATVSWGMVERLRNAGLKVRGKDVGLAIFVILIISMIISLIMRRLSDLGLDNLSYSQFWLEMIVVFIAFIVTFLSVIMGSLMGGHLSKGWYLLAFGSIMFSITFTLTTVFSAMGLYGEYIFIETFDVMALNSVTFSAYIQRKRHLELINAIM